jgi:hypothetical protein
MHTPRSLLTTVLACGALAACGISQDDADPARRKPRVDAGAVDASPVSSIDSATTGSTGAGVVTCYREGDPGATCSGSEHCCFSNYSAAHNGYCTTSTCAFGTINCDGPEDCASGETCCAHAITDPNDGTIGYTISCQTGACGAAPLNEELCHTASTCSTGGACESALGNQNDLPRTLSICL